MLEAWTITITISSLRLHLWQPLWLPQVQLRRPAVDEIEDDTKAVVDVLATALGASR